MCVHWLCLFIVQSVPLRAAHTLYVVGGNLNIWLHCAKLALIHASKSYTRDKLPVEKWESSHRKHIAVNNVGRNIPLLTAYCEHLCTMLCVQWLIAINEWFIISWVHLGPQSMTKNEISLAQEVLLLLKVICTFIYLFLLFNPGTEIRKNHIYQFFFQC